jgi:hypothetical protein
MRWACRARARRATASGMAFWAEAMAARIERLVSSWGTRWESRRKPESRTRMKARRTMARRNRILRRRRESQLEARHHPSRGHRRRRRSEGRAESIWLRWNVEPRGAETGAGHAPRRRGHASGGRRLGGRRWQAWRMVTAPAPSGNHRRCGILRDFARVAFAHGRAWNLLVRSWGTKPRGTPGLRSRNGCRP